MVQQLIYTVVGIWHLRVQLRLNVAFSPWDFTLQSWDVGPCNYSYISTYNWNCTNKYIVRIQWEVFVVIVGLYHQPLGGSTYIFEHHGNRIGCRTGFNGIFMYIHCEDLPVFPLGLPDSTLSPQTPAEVSIGVGSWITSVTLTRKVQHIVFPNNADAKKKYSCQSVYCALIII